MYSRYTPIWTYLSTAQLIEGASAIVYTSFAYFFLILILFVNTLFPLYCQIYRNNRYIVVRPW